MTLNGHLCKAIAISTLSMPLYYFVINNAHHAPNSTHSPPLSLRQKRKAQDTKAPQARS